jgi:hypothetical protein
VRIFSANANLKNYGCSFSSFPIQYGGFPRRIHKLYAKICIVSYRRACRRGLRESNLGTEKFPKFCCYAQKRCAPGDTAPLSSYILNSFTLQSFCQNTIIVRLLLIFLSLLYNKTLNVCSLGKQFVLFPLESPQ